MEADIKIAGTFTTHLECRCCQSCVEKFDHTKCGKCLAETNFFHIRITGKWLNYGVLLVIFGLDCLMLKNQVSVSSERGGRRVGGGGGERGERSNGESRTAS
jgi:hypothetical protein